jgi:hypothetical protein
VRFRIGEIVSIRSVHGHDVTPAAQFSGDRAKRHRDAIDFWRERFRDDREFHVAVLNIIYYAP